MTAPPWLPEDDALVSASSVGEGPIVAQFLNRTPAAVRNRRCELRRMAREGKTPLYLPVGRQSPKHPPTPAGEKWCLDCGASRPVAEFHPRAKSNDGRQGLCKAHSAERLRTWRVAVKTKVDMAPGKA